jgi:hypothetical protein
MRDSIRGVLLRIKKISDRSNRWRWITGRVARKRLKQLKADATMKLYDFLGKVHLALVTVAGLVIVVRGSSLFGAQVVSRPTSWLFFLAYVGCDLVRITFLRGTTISLSFPLILLTLVTDSPLAASFSAILGSLLSETLYSKFLSKQHMPLILSLRRAFFYAGHHAVSSFGALAVYLIMRMSFEPWLLSSLHLQAMASYVVIYAFLSMLLIWPHDYRVYRVLAPDEERFVRVDLVMTLLLIPLPAVAFYLYNLNVGQIAKLVTIVGILPPLFLLLFYLARRFAQTEEERMWLAVKDFARNQLGSPANMTEMVQRIFSVTRQLVSYPWGAIYGLDDKNLVLLATKRDREKAKVWDTGITDEEKSAKGVTPAEKSEVVWPKIIRLGEGYLGKMARVFGAQPYFAFESSMPSKSSDPYLPRQTALMPIPIAVREHAEDGQERPTLVGLVALARPNRMFTIIDQKRGQALGSQAGSVFLSVQRLEKALRELYQKVENYTREPESVRQAMQELMTRQVDVAQILSVVAERSFRSNWRTVLRGMVEGREEDELSLSREMLEDIYHQVRDETPGMPPLTNDILRLSQIVTSSLSLAFSLPYQWPDVQRGTEFKEMYEILLDALEANTVSRIVALDSRIVVNVQALREKPPEVQATLPTAAVDAIQKLRQVVQQLQNFQVTQDLPGQKSALSRALDKVVEQDRKVQQRVQDPERLILLQVLSGWRTTITNALEELSREPAQLALSLRSNRVLPLEEIAVALALKNKGLGPAYRVVARLEPAPDYKVTRGEADLGSLAAGKMEDLEFTLQPQGESPLRIQFRVTYSDAERKGKVEEFADLLHLRESLTSFTEILNPYTPGLPLKPGNPTFVGREDIFKFISQRVATLLQKAILVLVGERRTGKTSILQQLPDHLNDPRYIPIYVDGNGLGIDPGMGNFFLSLAEAIVDGLNMADISIPRLSLQELGDSPQHVFQRRFLPRIRERIGDRTLLLCIDEFEELGARVRSGALPKSVFSALRHLMQHGEQLAFIFSGTHKIEDMIGDYWSVLFNVAEYRRVGFLDRDSTVRLITEPVQPYGTRYDDLAVEEVLNLTAGHPYFTQLLCNVLVNQCNDDKRNYVTIQDVRRAMDELLEAGQAHLTYVWQTSDPEAHLCLAALADLLTRMDQISAAAIANRLGAYQVSLDPGRITRTMTTLTAKEIVREIPGNPVTYGFRAQVYTHWLRRYKSLNKIIEETGNVPTE